MIAETRDLADRACRRREGALAGRPQAAPARQRVFAGVSARLDRAGRLRDAPRPPSIPSARVQSAPAHTGPVAIRRGRTGATSPYAQKCRAYPRRGSGSRTRGEGTPDIFVHMETLRRFGLAELRPGQYVLVRSGPGPKGLMAAEVRLEGAPLGPASH